MLPRGCPILAMRVPPECMSMRKGRGPAWHGSQGKVPAGELDALCICEYHRVFQAGDSTGAAKGSRSGRMVFEKGNRMALEDSELAAVRRRMKWRRRRIIYNNDGNEPNVKGANTPEAFHATRNKHLLGTNVDSVFYCSGATTMFTHLTQVAETFGEFVADDHWEYCVNGRDNIRALAESGHDVLALAVEFCRSNDIEVFFSHRINDIHDAIPAWTTEMSRWKREHPEYLMGEAGDYEKYGRASPKAYWTALDFERPEVLDYLLRIIEDVCRRYDVDGIEIDYFRSPLLFRPNLEFEDATRAQADLLTAFQERIRQMTFREAERRGRPILIAARTPMTEERCLHVGIDVVRWMQDDLIDLLIGGGGYVPFTQPNATIVELGHRHDVPVYPCINVSGLRSGDYSKIGYDTPEGWRGACANIWASGADGVYAFNIFPEREKALAVAGSEWGPAADVDPRFTEIGDPETLATLDKIFAIDRWTVDEGDLAQGIVQDRVLPVTLDPSGPVTVVLPVADDIAAADKKGVLDETVLTISLSGLGEGDSPTVRLNGNTLGDPEERDDPKTIRFRPPASSFRNGDNEITFRFAGRDKTPPEVRAVELSVSYKQNASP